MVSFDEGGKYVSGGGEGGQAPNVPGQNTQGCSFGGRLVGRDDWGW